MKIGFNMLAVTGHVTDEHAPVLERLKALGYDGVEVPVFEGAGAHYRSLGSRLRAIGLEATIAAIVTEDANPISRERVVRARARDRLHWSIDCAHALGATLMMGPFHSPLGVFTGDGPTVEEIERLADAMHEAAVHAEGAGVMLSLEPLNRFECYVLNTLAQAADLSHRVGHRHFGCTFDTFHANIEERDPVEAYRTHAREVNHVHISENDRGIPGRGHAPIAAAIRAVRAEHYDGWLTVEAFGRSVPALAAATRVWRDLFPDLDTLFSESIAVIRRHWAGS
ncbi:sugar phosphate isomerase/epimerase family protein [Labrys wisconsinensis]|uniref:D-psicose/D-tagatose/L-ribulose 3-epimerase n=1 Tax=Labrys wisconsinensis TaxID=425677 RepID=A0ABU0JHV0_9HYPH|nr:sugar phosphate isomerase/epimerase family protein [Labrys wisconsinensis]MDQ0473857.1 D-psicose/D-tagatose/L-ribulose 3-epimerase [Labrys wisconsinensis]